MMISVIIPTRDRSDSLKNTILSLKNQVISEELGLDYEIIVVDNNSTDGTKELVKDMGIQMNGRLKYIFESDKGASCARNKGIESAEGEIISFIDDDCTAVKNWLNEIALTFKNYNADAVLGKISLVLPAQRPEWIPEWFLEKRLAKVDYGIATRRIDDKDLVAANISFKSEIFKKFGGFPSGIEPCEDTMYSRIITRRGAVKFYCPGAEVFHWIPSERLTGKYFSRQAHRWGFVKYSLAQDNKTGIELLPWLFKELIKDILGLILNYLKGKKTEHFLALCNIYDKMGIAKYLITRQFNLLKPE
ncbi:glycosyltransferase [bacterium]|nr:MAG: glycosyltransferase [bacterium]